VSARGRALLPVLCGALLAACVHPAHDHEASVTMIDGRRSALPGLGSEHAPQVDRAARLAAANELDEAAALVEAVLADFAALMAKREAKYVCVANSLELDLYREQVPEGSELVWIDWSYCAALHERAFILVARGRLPEGLAALDAEIAAAPFGAAAHNEKGFVQNKLGHPELALKSYQRALELSSAHASQAADQPLALRGLGFSLTELGRFDQAEAAYRRSLELDPDNEIALNELEYLRRARDAR